MATKQKLDEVLGRGTIAEILPSREGLEKHLLSGKPFHIYLGIDPTNAQMHLGHIQNILFLEDLRQLGAQVTLLFGSFTGLVGDPTGKSKTRSKLTRGQIKKNMKTWRKQVSPVLDLSLFGGARIRYNHTWFNLFSMADFLELMHTTTAQQLLERDMFQDRIKSGEALYTHEMMYPLLQAYDSVAMKVDGELCGTDQTFNALMGRTFVKKYLDKEKFVVAMKLIEADGVLMSKSAGTGVFVDVGPRGNHNMYGSIMALPDGFILPLFYGCTRIPVEEIERMDMSTGVALRDAKAYLAHTIVSMFWGKQGADIAQKAYQDQFQKGEMPDDVKEIQVTEGEKLLPLVAKHAAKSSADAKRKFAQGAVTLDGEKILDVQYTLEKKSQMLKVGRHIFHLQ